MVLKMSFEKKCNRVASGGAAWDPITLLAKEHIGITRYLRVHSRPNLELATLPAKKKSAEMLLPQRGRATARAARNGRHAYTLQILMSMFEKEGYDWTSLRSAFCSGNLDVMSDLKEIGVPLGDRRKIVAALEFKG